MIRLYFNKNGKKPWSWDRGSGTEERQVSFVEFRGIVGRCIFEPTAGDDIDTPTAWVSIEGARVVPFDDGVLFQSE